MQNVSDDVLGEEDNFRYLVSLTCRAGTEVHHHIVLACRGNKVLNNMWKSKMGRSFRLLFFMITFESALFYGTDTWPLTKGLD